LKYKENLKCVPCEQCGRNRKFRYVKHNGTYKNYRPLCASCSGRSRIHPTKNYFNLIDTEEKAYSFGFFWADGCINRHKTFTVRLQTIDSDILDFFHNYFGGSRHLRKFKRVDGRVYYQEEWVIHDINWNKHLKNIGFRQHLNNIPTNLFNHFLRGLLDGDGSYSYLSNKKLGVITLSSNYDDNFEWITKYLTNKHRISKTISKTGKSSTLTFTGGDAILSNFVNEIYQNSTVYLFRKFTTNKHKII
jgi:hypothetical protein